MRGARTEHRRSPRVRLLLIVLSLAIVLARAAAPGTGTPRGTPESQAPASAARLHESAQLSPTAGSSSSRSSRDSREELPPRPGDSAPGDEALEKGGGRSLLAAPSSMPDDAVFRALRAELLRARSSLHLDPDPTPYFIAASVSDVDTAGLEASYGAVTSSSEQHERSLDVSVRVGDRTLDSSRFARRDAPFRFGGAEMPEEDNELELRRALWLALDQAYKDAVEDLARKKAVLEGRMRSAEEKLPDFSDERPQTTVVPVPASRFRRPDWELRARRLSALLRAFPAIQSSSVRIVFVRRVIRYLDTDAGVALHARSLWLLEAGAETQADDGMPLRDFVSFYARSPEEAPTEETMASAVKEMGRRLTSMRSAPVLEEPVSGPVLLEDQAAAEFFLALVGQSAAVTRDPVQEDPRFGAAMGSAGGGSPWRGRLGSRVASDFLGARDDPTLRDFRGLSLIGSYAADDEGIPAQSVNLVEKGILRGVLSTRTPVKGAARSNGHARTLFGSALQSSRAAPGVLIVTASNERAIAPADVRARLLEAVRDRGLDSGWIIRRVQNDAANPSHHEELSMWMSGRGSRPSLVADPIEVVRVSADGAETPVRGIHWGNLDVRTLKDLLLASSGEGGEAAFNTRAAPPGFAGWQSGGALPTSVICPRSVLIEEVELAPAGGEFPAPPVLPHPLFTPGTAAK